MADDGLLSELPESRATGPIGDIYDQIRTWSGVPMVALIYRYFATLPGVLEWAWEEVRPLMESGLLQERAEQLAASVQLPDVLPIPAVAREAAGITADEEALIRSSLAAFNRSNPINVLFLRCLKRRLDGSSPELAAPVARPWTPPAQLPPLQPMVHPDDMEPPVREIISGLVHRGHGRHAGIWPSLYRHLAAVPSYLALVSVVLPPHMAGVDRAVSDLDAEVEQAVTDLIGRTVPSTLAAPTGETLGIVRRAMEEFTELIPEMVVVGAVLERATQARGS